MCSLSSFSCGDNVVIVDFEMGGWLLCHSRFQTKSMFSFLLSFLWHSFTFDMSCRQVPEQDNGSPVCQFTLEILRVRSNTESLNGQKTNSKKSARNRSTNVDTSILKEMAVWEPVFDGNSLQYASHLLIFREILVLHIFFQGMCP